MKRKILIVVAGLAVLFILGFAGIYVWIDLTVKKNISIATEKYPGIAEDALIAYLTDTTNAPGDRSHIAVWTLGQIHSEKAIPVLESYYLDDPEGKTCYGRHDLVLCQYEIYKALNASRSNFWPLHARLNR